MGFPLFRFDSLFQVISVSNTGIPPHRHFLQKNDLIYDKHVRIIFNCGFFIALVELRSSYLFCIFSYWVFDQKNNTFALFVNSPISPCLNTPSFLYLYPNRDGMKSMFIKAYRPILPYPQCICINGGLCSLLLGFF